MKWGNVGSRKERGNDKKTSKLFYQILTILGLTLTWKGIKGCLKVMKHEMFHK